VAAPNERLKQTASQLKTLANERNEAVKQCSDLAERHKKLVKDRNELQARLAENAKAMNGTKP
jgi:hypothetical protein